MTNQEYECVISDLITQIKELEKRLQDKSKEELKVRTIQGLGGVIYSIKLEHLCMMFALSGLAANFNYSKPHVKDIVSEAVQLGSRLNELIEISESMEAFQAFEPEVITGEDEPT